MKKSRPREVIIASKYLRGKTWWISYYQCGKLVQYSLKTRDKATAQYRLNEIENKLARGDSPVVEHNIPAWKCFEAFKQSRAGRLAAKTQNADHYRIEKFLVDEKIQSLKQITRAQLKSHLDRRIERDKISHMTANHTIRAVKTFLNFCVGEKHLFENPIRRMEMYPVDEKEPRFLTPDELKIFFQIALTNEPEVYIAVVIAVYSGMRWGEIERLNDMRSVDGNWIDFEQNNIHITKSKRKKSGHIRATRKIPLHSDLRKILEPLRGQGRFIKITQDQLECRFEKLMDIATGDKYKIQRFRFHDLRHTFASLMVRAGVDIYTLSKLLGHSSVKTTEIYAHLYDDNVVDAINRLKI